MDTVDIHSVFSLFGAQAGSIQRKTVLYDDSNESPVRDTWFLLSLEEATAVLNIVQQRETTELYCERKT